VRQFSGPDRFGPELVVGSGTPLGAARAGGGLSRSRRRPPTTWRIGNRTKKSVDRSGTDLVNVADDTSRRRFGGNLPGLPVRCYRAIRSEDRRDVKGLSRHCRGRVFEKTHLVMREEVPSS
jgi:hypothetical protein